MNKLDFICVGFPKCGTTSLHKSLSSHPEISLPSAKELPCFDSDTPDLGLVENFLSMEPEGKVYGKVTPQYVTSSTAINNIAKYNPDIKVIVMLRNPEDRWVSHYHMLNNRGLIKKDPSSLFASYLNGECDAYHKDLFESSRYDHYLNILFETFGSDQVLICNLESLKESDSDEMLRITDFLGVESFSLPFKSSNTSRVSFIRKYSDPLLWKRNQVLSLLYPILRGAIPKYYRKSIAFKLKTIEFGNKPKDIFLPSELRSWLYDKAKVWE